MSNDNVTLFPQHRGRRKDDGPQLFVVRPSLRSCTHRRFIIDQTLARVICRQCGEHLDPIWCLQQLSVAESHFQQQLEFVAEETARLNARKRTKCQHCKKQTEISRS